MGNAPAAHNLNVPFSSKVFCRYHKLKAGKHLLLQGFFRRKNPARRRYLCAMAWHFCSLTFRGNKANLASVVRLPLWLGMGVMPSGGEYEICLCLLRGVGFRGGPLGFQAGTNAGG